MGEFPRFFLFLLCTLFILCSDPIAALGDSHIHLFLKGISHMHKHLRSWCFLIACLGTEAADPFGAGLDWEGSNITSRCLHLQKLAQVCSAVGKPLYQFFPLMQVGLCLQRVYLSATPNPTSRLEELGARSMHWAEILAPCSNLLQKLPVLQQVCSQPARAVPLLGQGRGKGLRTALLSPGVCEESAL